MISQVLRLAETDSTQTVARFLAERGAAAGTLVRADRQTAGRGRLSRRWESKPGGLYFSLILRPAFGPGRLAEFSLAAAAAAAAALRGLTGLETTVKAPNDVLVGRRKVCGILAEASGGSRKLDWLVVGVGINVNNAPKAPGASSLKSLTGRVWDLDRVLDAFLAELERRLRRPTSTG